MGLLFRNLALYPLPPLEYTPATTSGEYCAGKKYSYYKIICPGEYDGIFIA